MRSSLESHDISGYHAGLGFGVQGLGLRVLRFRV